MITKEMELAIKTPQYHTQFWNYIKKPNTATENVLPKEARSFSPTAYLFPKTSIQLLSEKLSKYSPFRQISSCITLNQGATTLHYFDCVPKTVWTTNNGFPIEEEQKTLETTTRAVQHFIVSSLIRLSNEVVCDHSFALEDYLTTVLAKEFAKEESKALIHGDGVTTPAGLLHKTKGAKVGYSTSSLTLDALHQLYFSLDSEYRMNGTWIMSDETYLKLKLLKDDTGQYLWKDELLLGKPVVVINAMNNATYPVAFGGFSNLWIIERLAPSVKVLEELFYFKDQTAYLAHHRIDALLTDQNAVKLLEVKG
ncbi:phage major capsid protein [Clostridium perfringens]|uniref:phage major capsid protein n=1 Tax=Clostridium perfringens TaxID=1502 RepID=UPI0039EB960C